MKQSLWECLWVVWSPMICWYSKHFRSTGWTDTSNLFWLSRECNKHSNKVIIVVIPIHNRMKGSYCSVDSMWSSLISKEIISSKLWASQNLCFVKFVKGPFSTNSLYWSSIWPRVGSIKLISVSTLLFWVISLDLRNRRVWGLNFWYHCLITKWSRSRFHLTSNS